MEERQLALFTLIEEVEVGEDGVLCTLYIVWWNGTTEVLSSVLL